MQFSDFQECAENYFIIEHSIFFLLKTAQLLCTTGTFVNT